MTALTAQDFNGTISKTAGAANTTAEISVKQFIDSGTPEGLYTFKISTGLTGTQSVKEVKVRVQNPKPEINFYLDGFDSLVSGAATRDQVVDILPNGTYVLEKPTVAGINYSLSFFSTLLNYQSKLLTANEFAEVTADSLVTTLSDKKLFNATSTAIGTSARSADMFVTKGIVAPIPAKEIKAYITNKHSADLVVTVSKTDETGIASILRSPTTVTVLKESTQLVTLGTVSTTADAANNAKTTFTISSSEDVKLFFSNPKELNKDTFVVMVSDYPDVEVFGSKVLSGTNSYRFVDLSLEVDGPSKLINEIPTSRTAILLKDYDKGTATAADGLVLFNQTGAFINTTQLALTGLSLDTGALSSATNLASSTTYKATDYFDNDGFIRNKLAINNTTVEGTYTLRFKVDSLVKEVKLQVVQSKPKVFVLSGLDSGKKLDSSFLPKDGNLGNTKFKSEYELLKYYNADKNLEDETEDNAGTGNGVDTIANTEDDDINSTGKFDLYVAPVNGVYTVELPSSPAVFRDVLYAKIAVADLAKGNYNYSVVKKYPDGRVENFSDVVQVVDVNANGVAIFTGATGTQLARNNLFISRWIIKETSIVKGTYEYTFTINNVSKKYVINVVEPPSFTITSLSIDGNELGLFNKIYRVLFGDVLGDVTAQFELENLLETDLFDLFVTENDTGSANNITTSDIATSANSVANFADAADLLTIKDLARLDLGSIVLASGETGLAATDATYLNDKFTFTFKFYRPISRVGLDETGFPYQLIGTQTVVIQIDN
jgi:5-hydroxyisourate hydrolase-like protein (transthyretin family)